MLVSSRPIDDAGVYRLNRDSALVQTVDFFTPIVDDPYVYGQIAAANAFSDVYAMGGRPLTALNLVGIPVERVPAETLVAILRGGAAKAKEAKCALIGGHSIRNPEPIYGLAVTGLVSPRRMITQAKARPGDWLVLTKPLGTGIVTTGIKRDLAPQGLIRKSIGWMRKLNSAGPELAERGWIQAGTDITGFGLLGHLISMCQASGVGAQIDPDRLPVLGKGVFELIAKDCVPGGSRENQNAAEPCTDWANASPAQKILMTDAQTSGGLLLCVAPRHLEKVRNLLKERRAPCAAVFGRIIGSSKGKVMIKPS